MGDLSLSHDQTTIADGVPVDQRRRHLRRLVRQERRTGIRPLRQEKVLFDPIFDLDYNRWMSLIAVKLVVIIN